MRRRTAALVTAALRRGQPARVTHTATRAQVQGLSTQVHSPVPPAPLWQPQPVEAPVVVADRLTGENLADLVAGRSLVLRVPNFVPDEQCARLAEYLVGSDRREQYTHEIYDDDGRPQQVYLGVDRVGVPFNSTYGHAPGSPAWRRYFDEALPAVRALREAAGPEPAPTDRLRLEMDELLPAGASVAAVHGRKMLCGIGRLMNAELSGESEAPHFGAMPAETLPVRKQLAANFYLEVPEEGGELEIWSVPPLEYDQVIDASNTSPDELRAALPESTIVRPARGDLLLFSTRRPHAIRGFAGGRRTTLQTFFGELEGGRIVLWN